MNFGGRLLDFSRPRIMGVLNLTPDSFSDGGLWTEPGAALGHALEMIEAGADLVDVGGESTRPGAEEVSVERELERVIPVIEKLAPESPVPVSVDTSKPEVMLAAADAGAGLINDVCALQSKGALAAAVATGLPVCLMHMQGEPRTMQEDPRYGDVTNEVESFLLGRAQACMVAGIGRDQIILDPGFGFGKALEHNLQLLRDLRKLAGHGFPVLAGLSRKSMLGAISGNDASDRQIASVTAAVLAVQAGAAIVRVHDVPATREALDVLEAVWPSALEAE